MSQQDTGLASQAPTGSASASWHSNEQGIPTSQHQRDAEIVGLWFLLQLSSQSGCFFPQPFSN